MLGVAAVACQVIADLEDRSVDVVTGDAATMPDTSEVPDVAPPCETCGGSTCVDLQTNQANCGYCGHVCGPKCTSGTCPGVLVSKLASTLSLAVDDTNVYYSFGSQIFSLPKTPPDAGLNPPKPFVNLGSYVEAITIAQKRMFVATAYRVMELASNGATISVVSDRDGGPQNQHLAADPPTIVWSSDFGVSSALVDGGDPKVLAADQDAALIVSIATDPTSVYYADSNFPAVFGVPRDGGGAPKIWVQGKGGSASIYPNGVATTAGFLYSGMSTGLFVTPLDGGKNAYLSVNNVIALSIVKGRVVWYEVDFTQTTGKILSAPLAGGPTVLLADQLGGASAFTADDTAVYWIGVTNAPGDTNYTLRFVPF